MDRFRAVQKCTIAAYHEVIEVGETPKLAVDRLVTALKSALGLSSRPPQPLVE